VLASPFRSWSLATQKHAAQGRKAAPAGGPIGTKSGGSITPKSGGPIPTKSGGSIHTKSCKNVGINEVEEKIWLITFMNYALNKPD